MKKGLVLGKFMPLHNGHLALFDFASTKCDELFILLCYSENEPIPGTTRKGWLIDALIEIPNAVLLSYQYNEAYLPNTSVSSRDVSLKWSKVIKDIVPNIDVIFSSELYGDYLAEYLGCEHIAFDPERKAIPVSASAILANPLMNWNFISTTAKSYFLGKVILLGTESTGKSTLTKKLAAHFNTSYVPEMAREILERTEDCQPQHLIQIAELHAKEILKKTEEANGLLFIDTDINITKSYSQYLFNETLVISDWVEEANKGQLYLFLEPDCEFIQDGTRLFSEERDKLSLFHKDQLEKTAITYFSVYGNWDERFEKATTLIKNHFNI